MLSLESESLLVDSPGPMVEIKFWEAKCLNLECLHEQVRGEVILLVNKKKDRFR